MYIFELITEYNINKFQTEKTMILNSIFKFNYQIIIRQINQLWIWETEKD